MDTETKAELERARNNAKHARLTAKNAKSPADRAFSSAMARVYARRAAELEKQLA